jgi:hypothetical protein
MCVWPKLFARFYISFETEIFQLDFGLLLSVFDISIQFVQIIVESLQQGFSVFSYLCYDGIFFHIMMILILQEYK